MNVFKEMVCSVGKPSAYPNFLKNNKGKIFIMRAAVTILNWIRINILMKKQPIGFLWDIRACF